MSAAEQLDQTSQDFLALGFELQRTRAELLAAKADVARLVEERKLFASKLRRLGSELTGRVSVDAKRVPNSHRRVRYAR